ncbi:Response regulatory domain-containing protein [Heracleum sosnowskyi]|uniref:Response regulatory domain-containing protein n=1 Tax=Heracleum sosnowskyi TaxID=360622 RepID=A0AAD8MEP5_9APIA|nr:Response regulatory domain-containing protein [Heracleum sosnowskyi]
MATEVGSSMIARRIETALVVDDCSVVRMLNTKLLSILGLKVSSAKDAVEAVAMYEAGEGNFDLIVMDLEMPRMNGIEATTELRAMGVDCMIIGATACDDVSRRQRFMEAGLDRLFNKPLTIANLKSCLN